MLFDKMRESLTYNQDSRSIPPVYCGCFSQHPDLLSQWRGYAADGTGVAIGFRRSYLSAIDHPLTKFADVDYDQKSQVEAITKIIEASIIDLEMELNKPRVPDEATTAVEIRCLESLDTFAPFAKSPAFSEERESRLRYTRIFAQGVPPMSPLDFHESRAKITPFYSMPISSETQGFSIQRIILGPKNHKHENREAIMLIMREQGISFALDQIFESSASYR